MTGWWFGSDMRDRLRCHGRPGWIDWKASITTSPVRTFCGMRKSGLEEGTTALSNGEQVNRLAALSLKRGESADFGGYWQRHSKDVHA
jgi:hypothetical protein